MRILLLFLFWVCTPAVVIGLGYGLWTVVSGYLAVKYAPREEMFFCQKHGMLRKANCLEFLGTPACSICFHDNLVDAEKFRVGQQRGGQIIN